jgi:NAD(P)-dependent dehydrogenase (short-subunit alcohol dehydrogenase family)
VPSPFDIDGRIAVITGAAQGIGAAYAHGLAAVGATVVLVDVAPKVEEVVGDLRSAGHTAFASTCDVADPTRVDKLAEFIDRELGVVDILVNNAAVEGVASPTPVLTLDPQTYDRVQAVNVKAMWLMVRALHTLLMRSAGPSVINQGSTGAFTIMAGYLPYITSKNAVIGLTKALAKELGPDGIRVNSIAPGMIDTEGLRAVAPPEVVQTILASQAIPKLQAPADLVDPLIFLASDASRFITGQTLVVDGGAVLLP